MVRVARHPFPGCCRSLCVDSDKPCENWRDIDALGFCKYHTPLSLQCRATKVTDGVQRRCRVRWGLDEQLLCKYHPGWVIACHAHCAATGERCASTEDIDLHGFCPRHVPRLQDLVREVIWKLNGWMSPRQPNKNDSSEAMKAETQQQKHNQGETGEDECVRETGIKEESRVKQEPSASGA